MMVGENKGFNLMKFLKENKINVRISEYEKQERQKIVLLNEKGRNVLKVQKTELIKKPEKVNRNRVRIVNW